MKPLLDSLTEDGYKCLVPDEDGTYYGLSRLVFTWGLFVKIGRFSYSHRYCYHNLLDAAGAYSDWKKNGFEGEPEGYIVRKGLNGDKRGAAYASEI